MKNIKITTVSSLAKVFEDEICGKEISSLALAKNQELNYQIVLKGEGEYTFKINAPEFDIYSYRVGHVPVKLPTYEGVNDGKYLRLEPGSFPDPLFPITDTKITLEKGKYTAIWLSASCARCAGEHKIEVTFYKDGACEGKSTLDVSVYDIDLPEQRLIFTQWFHNDCIASVHDVEIFSSEHWSLIEKYIKIASEHGMNMLLTPVLTPPLDTEVGGERPTVQLVDIKKSENGYEFNLDKLEKYVNIATECGIKYFEINHFFTQWGARSAPKVIAEVDGVKTKIFGWETDASSSEYADFLRALVPEIIKKLTEMGIEKKNIFFHVSDEPSHDQLDAYSRASAILTPLVQECNQLDALSNLEYYKAGVVKTPVVATNAIEPFLEHGVSDLWCYYCCAQAREVGNRFMAMPSTRNRILGVQMYLNSIVGFLHWGYNFYFTQYSKIQKLNPYEETQAGGAFPSGDAFSVYPYENGVIPSLRLKVFKDALNDIRLLSLLEEKIGREATNKLIAELAGEKITFKEYPLDEDFFHILTKKALELS